MPEPNNTAYPPTPPLPPSLNELKTTASTYHQLGLPVTTCTITQQTDGTYKKDHYTPWQTWTKQPQTQQEFDNLTWTNKNGFGICLTHPIGTNKENMVYLTVIDYDPKNKTEPIKQLGKKIIDQFPPTRTEQTVNNGLHLLYYTKQPAKQISQYHTQTGIELLADKKLCIMAPSHGYSTLDNREIHLVENITDLFNQILKQNGVNIENQPNQPQLLLPQQSIQMLNSEHCTKEMLWKNVRPCIQQISKENLHHQSKIGHDKRVCLGTELKANNWPLKEIINIFSLQPDFNHNTTLNQINSLKETRPWTCETITQQLNACLKEKCPIYLQKQKNKGDQTNNTKNTNTNNTPNKETFTDNTQVFKEKYGVSLEQFEKDLYQLSVNPNIENFILDEIHKTVSKHDEHVVKTVLRTAVSTYATPLNLALKCESGSGKTYSTVQTLKFLPPEDVQLIGSQSPKVISHKYGILLDKNGEPIPDEPPCAPHKYSYKNTKDFHEAQKEYNVELSRYRDRLKDSYHLVDLWNKILVFLEAAGIETFKMLKPTLSHDDEYIDHQYVDDKGKVHNTKLWGWPAGIFNSLDEEYMSEFATRTLTVSPNTSQNKIEDANAISSKKAAYPFRYKKESYEKVLIQEYFRHVKKVCKNEKIKTLVPFPSLDKIFRSSETRDMRDYGHFLEMVPAVTLLNLFQRPIITIDDVNYVVSTVQDVIDAKALFDSILLTTQTGTEKKVIDFYYDFVKPQSDGVTVKDLTVSYNQVQKQKKKKPVSSRTIARYLSRLVVIEWVNVLEGTVFSSHEFVYFPLHGLFEDEKQTQLFSEEKVSGKTCVTLLDKTVLSNDLVSICQKEFSLWLDSVGHLVGCVPLFFLRIKGSSVEISVEEFKEKIFFVAPSVVCHSVFKPEIGSILKNGVDAVDKIVLSSNVKCVAQSFAGFASLVECVEVRSGDAGVPCACCSEEGACNCVAYFLDGSYKWICQKCYQQLAPYIQPKTVEKTETEKQTTTQTTTVAVVGQQPIKSVKHYKPLPHGKPTEQCPSCNTYPIQYIVEHKDKQEEHLCGVCLKQHITNSQPNIQWINKNNKEKEETETDDTAAAEGDSVVEQSGGSV